MKKTENKKRKQSHDMISKDSLQGQQRPALFLDIDYYQSLLDSPEVSEKQQQEFIESMWSIVVQFVDMGFGVHPLQQTDERADDAKQDKTRKAISRLIAAETLGEADEPNHEKTELKEAWSEGGNHDI